METHKASGIGCIGCNCRIVGELLNNLVLTVGFAFPYGSSAKSPWNETRIGSVSQSSLQLNGNGKLIGNVVERPKQRFYVAKLAKLV